jgi:signal transduction histidine kinase
MTRLAHLMQPTLARRLVLTLLAAFGVVWIVLIAYYYSQEAGQTAIDRQASARGEIVTAALAKIDNAQQARAAIAIYSDFFNSGLRHAGVPGYFLMQLEDRQGARLFMSPEGGAASLHGVAGKFTDHAVNGVRYHVFRGDTAQWTVLIGEPQLDDGWLLARLGSNLGMSILIAFPFVLLPAWFAVARGLRPLRRLSDAISARGPDDLAPLGFDARYAELKPVAAALDHLLSKLRVKIAREHAFVQDAAHELRTPMAVIAAQVHVLEKASGPDERRVAGQQAERAIARASHLVQQLLDLARIDSAGAGTADAVDVAQLVRQEMAAAAPDAIARGIDLSLEAPDTLPYPLEAHTFQSIVQNLLSNAMRYVPQGGRVEVELVARDGMLALAVSDDGPGIAEGERALVFERFYRVAGNEASGSGLGLAIVSQAVARLRGTVRIETGLDGRGCKFIVELPGR